MLQTTNTVAQMADESLLDGAIDVVHLADEATDLLRAIGEAGLEFVQHAAGVQLMLVLLLVLLLLVVMLLMVMVVDLVVALMMAAVMVFGRTLDGLQMFDGHLEDVGFFEFRVAGGLRNRKRIDFWIRDLCAANRKLEA